MAHMRGKRSRSRELNALAGNVAKPTNWNRHLPSSHVVVMLDSNSHVIKGRPNFGFSFGFGAQRLHFSIFGILSVSAERSHDTFGKISALTAVMPNFGLHHQIRYGEVTFCVISVSPKVTSCFRCDFRFRPKLKLPLTLDLYTWS